MKRELPHVRTNAYPDDRLVCAGSCDPLPRTLEITKQVDDYFGAVLNSKKELLDLNKTADASSQEAL